MISITLTKNLISRSFLVRSRNFNLTKIPKRLQSTNEFDSNSHESVEKSNDPNFYDIVICGGGMVGSAMAYALGKEQLFKNLKVALIESSPKSQEYKSPEIHSNRTCALSQSTQNFFKDLGNWDFIETNRYGNVKHMHVWDSSSDAHIAFENDDGSNLAIIAENNLIQASLTRDLDKFSNLDILYSSELKNFQVETSFVDIELKDETKLRTNLLIGSDGPNSYIRQKAGFNVMKWDYDQMAIVATLKLSEPTSNNTAWQRFLSTGPIALLPLNDEYSSLVWSVKKQFFNELMSLSDAELASKVNHAFVSEDSKDIVASAVEEKVHKFLDFVKDSKILPQIETLNAEVRQLPPRIETCVEKTRGAYPLSFLHANNYVKSRIALIGDAVHRVHPLAGQGVNLGFGDVIALTEALKDNVSNGAELGTNMYLESYESIRQKEAFVKVAGIDMLNRLYTDHEYLLKTPLAALRSAGLTISNRIAPLKSFYKEQAMK